MPTSTHPNNVEIIVKGHVVRPDGGLERIVNRFTYATLTNPIVVARADFITSFINNVNTGSAWILAFAVGYICDTVGCRYMDNADYKVGEAAGAALNGANGGVGELAGPDSAVYMQYYTDFRGRSNFGSKHFSPHMEVDTTNGELNVTGQGLWNALKTRLATSIVVNGVTWFPTVMSQIKSQIAVNPTWIYSNAVANIQLDLTIGTMRRRRYPTRR